MNKQYRKAIVIRGFNLVEIVLAIGVLAVACSGVLTLLTVGINTNKAAIAENNLADAADYILEYFRSKIMHDIYTDIPLADWYTSLTEAGTETEINRLKWADDSIGDTNLYRASPVNARYYLYKQQTGDGKNVDFSAMVRIRCADELKIWCRDAAGEVVSETFNKLNPGAIRIYLELSWPADRVYAKREKRCYVMDISDPR